MESVICRLIFSYRSKNSGILCKTACNIICYRIVELSLLLIILHVKITSLSREIQLNSKHQTRKILKLDHVWPRLQEDKKHIFVSFGRCARTNVIINQKEVLGVQFQVTLRILVWVLPFLFTVSKRWQNKWSKKNQWMITPHFNWNKYALYSPSASLKLYPCMTGSKFSCDIIDNTNVLNYIWKLVAPFPWHQVWIKYKQSFIFSTKIPIQKNSKLNLYLNQFSNWLPFIFVPNFLAW